MYIILVSSVQPHDEILYNSQKKQTFFYCHSLYNCYFWLFLQVNKTLFNHFPNIGYLSYYNNIIIKLLNNIAMNTLVEILFTISLIYK